MKKLGFNEKRLLMYLITLETQQGAQRGDEVTFSRVFCRMDGCGQAPMDGFMASREKVTSCPRPALLGIRGVR